MSEQTQGPFDPTEHTVEQVAQYLRKAEAVGEFEEIDRVIEAERSRDDGVEPRVGVLRLAHDDDADDEDVEAADDDEKPEWDVRTHGKPPFGREGEYRVVGRT